jgi:hypothetical protein
MLDRRAGGWDLELLVNDVGRVVSWLESTVRLSPEDDGNLILAAAPQHGTPLVLPYSPGSAARAGRPTHGQSRRSFGSQWQAGSRPFAACRVSRRPIDKEQ